MIREILFCLFLFLTIAAAFQECEPLGKLCWMKQQYFVINIKLVHVYVKIILNVFSSPAFIFGVFCSVAYAGFWKGEAETSENLRRAKVWIRNCSAQNQSDFLPKNSWRAKINKKKVLTHICFHFSPKISWRAKKRSSLKFGPVFCPRLGVEQKNKKGFHSNLVRLLAQSREQTHGTYLLCDQTLRPTC